MNKKEINNMIREKIKKLRESRGLDIKQVAEDIGYDASNLSKIERGDRMVPKNLPIMLAEYYKVNLSYFYGEKTEVPEDLNSVGVEWITFIDKMKQQNLTPEEIENIIKVVKSLNK